MNTLNNTCKECGVEKKPSQYARRKLDGEPAQKWSENLVCRNYPSCPKAEKEVPKKL